MGASPLPSPDHRYPQQLPHHPRPSSAVSWTYPTPTSNPHADAVPFPHVHSRNRPANQHRTRVLKGPYPAHPLPPTPDPRPQFPPPRPPRRKPLTPRPLRPPQPHARATRILAQLPQDRRRARRHAPHRTTPPTAHRPARKNRGTPNPRTPRNHRPRRTHQPRPNPAIS